MESHNYEPISEARFQEIMKLQEQLLHDEISEEEFSAKVSKTDIANFRIMAQIKFTQVSKSRLEE